VRYDDEDDEFAVWDLSHEAPEDLVMVENPADTIMSRRISARVLRRARRPAKT